MGIIKYQANCVAVIYDEFHCVIGYAFQCIYDSHWELALKNEYSNDKILRALDSHLLSY